MHKKRILCALIAAALGTSALAGNFYVGPSLLLQHVSASHSSFNGIHPRLSLGYGNLSDNNYIGFELNGVPATATFSDSHSNSVSTKPTRSLGLSVIPGMMLNENVLGFLRIGILNTRFPGPSTSRTGAMLGVGLSTSLNDNWDIRGEYIYSAYQSISGLGSPKSNELGIGALYKFDA